MKDHTPRRPSVFLSLLPILALISMLAVTISIFGGDALGGSSQLVLLLAAGICSLIAVFYCKISWQTIQHQIATNIFGMAPSILIFLLIGSLSGTWMISGIVPMLIYYGLQIMTSDFFLLSCCILCCVVSIMTGSSWTTIATIGIALIAIGEVQGFSTGWTAGAIISGAYFGDKMSPLSDTTVLAASVTDTPLFTHIRYMLFTTVPSISIAFIVFGIVGLNHEGAVALDVDNFTDSLESTFRLTHWLWIVPIATAVMIARKVAPIIVLFASSLLAAIFAGIFQPHLLQEISGLTEGGWVTQLKGMMISFYGSTHIETGNGALNDLVSTKGMGGMMNTIWLILCAMCFGGAMTASGMIASISRVFVHFMRSRTSTVASTVVSGLLLIMCTADQFIAIILNSEMFKKVYKEKGFESRLLSRSTEDSVTVTSVLVPWTTCGMAQSTILGVATLTYLPYCIFNLVSPLMSILIAAIGYKIYRIKPEKE